MKGKKLPHTQQNGIKRLVTTWQRCPANAEPPLHGGVFGEKNTPILHVRTIGFRKSFGH